MKYVSPRGKFLRQIDTHDTMFRYPQVTLNQKIQLRLKNNIALFTYRLHAGILKSWSLSNNRGIASLYRYADVHGKWKSYVTRPGAEPSSAGTHALCRTVRNFRTLWSMSNRRPRLPIHFSTRFQSRLVNRTCYNSEWKSGMIPHWVDGPISAERQSANAENDKWGDTRNAPGHVL